MGFCVECGHVIMESERFCGECGTPADSESQPVQAVTPHVPTTVTPQPASLQPSSPEDVQTGKSSTVAPAVQAKASAKVEAGLGLRSVLLVACTWLLYFYEMINGFINLGSKPGGFELALPYVSLILTGAALWYGNRARKIPGQKVLGWIGFLLALFPIVIMALMMLLGLVLSLSH